MLRVGCGVQWLWSMSFWKGKKYYEKEDKVKLSLAC